MMKHILFLILFSLMIVGCSTKQVSDYSSKEYEGVNKDALLNAAKTVIKLSDKDFAIDAKRTSLEAIKISPIHKGLTVDINVNTINLMVYPDDKITRAKVKFTHKNNILNDKESILYDNALHELFWGRVDYILGLKDSWQTCTAYRLKLNNDGILCDIIHNQNNRFSKNDIIKDTGFQQKILLEDTQVTLANIDVKGIYNVELPLEYTIKDINTSDMEDVDLDMIDSEDIELTFEDTNDTNNSLELLDENIIEEVLDDQNNTQKD